MSHVLSSLPVLGNAEDLRGVRVAQWWVTSWSLGCESAIAWTCLIAVAVIWGNKQAAVNDDRRSEKDDTIVGMAWDEMCCALAGHRCCG
jgi:hypothetical protein